MADTESPPIQSSRRPRERAPGHQVDLADRLVALQRRAAGPPRRADRTPVASDQATPQPVLSSTQGPLPPQHSLRPLPSQPSSPPQSRTRSRPPREASPDEFDRRMPAGGLLVAPRPAGRLYDPHTDPLPRRLMPREPDAESDASSAANQPLPSRRRRVPASHSPGPSHPPPQLQQSARHLFDPRTDDPVRFMVLSRGAAATRGHSGAPSGGYVSASATSTSDAQSLASNFTLTSGTTSSSTSNPYSPANSKDIGGKGLWLEQMKRMYRDITNLEGQILGEGDVVDDDFDTRDSVRSQATRASDEKWAGLLKAHRDLVERCHNFLSFALKPQVPASLQTLPAKYNIPARLWNHGFQRLLAALRRASISSAAALEYLESFIIYAYGFYTSLLEEEDLNQFRVLWLEALGDLSRYQMAVVVHMAEGDSKNKPGTGHLALPTTLNISASNSPGVSRMDEGTVPSVGAQAAADMVMEDERELWRRNAREWYTKGVKDTPGQGRLHHHLGLVSVDVDGEELRAVYHFYKSLIAHHPCDIARESLLPLFSLEKQNVRYQPSSSATSIFLLMHGILFTRIQLDDFQPTVARFKERMELHPTEVTESEWIMMASLNISALLEYGRPEGVLRRICGWAASGVPGSTQGHAASKTPRDTKKPNASEDQMQVDSTVPNEVDDTAENISASLSGQMEALSTSNGTVEELPYALQLALQLTFELLLYTIRKPTIPSKSVFHRSSLNPYLTTILTFLSTVLKHEKAAQLLEKHVPWMDLLPFLTKVHQKTSRKSEDDASRPTARWFGTSPLPEDWCLRGAEWVRRVYERGFWRSSSKSDGGISSEMDVVMPPKLPEDDGDGVVENESEITFQSINWNDSRYKRLRWCAETIVQSVDGLEWGGEGAERQVFVGDNLMAKVELWMAEKAREEEAERKRRERVLWKDEDMEVDEPEEDDDDDDSEDSQEVKALKARRRYLRNLQSPYKGAPASRIPARRKAPKPKRPLLHTLPGYTILVCDTNILLSSLPLISGLISSLRWTVIVPLAVVTELDGLRTNPGELGAAAQAAVEYLTSAIQTHSISLKVQTSRGNYLPTLSVRSEETVLGHNDRNMDDIIVRAALWQQDHFFDRTNMLCPDRPTKPMEGKTSRVVLLTFDRNMRLKARSRKLDAADERDMAAILNPAS